MSSFFPPNNQRHKPGIGGFLIIIEHVVPAHRLNFLRQSHSQPPAREVDLMNSLIANISIAIGPPPVPVVVKTVLGERSDRSRSHPGTLGPTRTTCSTVVPPVPLSEGSGSFAATQPVLPGGAYLRRL